MSWLEKEDRLRVYDFALFTGAFLLIIWSVFLLNEEMGWQLKNLGVKPRKLKGLIGIFMSPLLHGDFDHIWGNTVSFTSLTFFLFFFYRKIAFKVFFLLYFLAGILLWVIGTGGNHIGASGVIYGLAAFIFFSGIMRDNVMLLRVSLAVAFLYGSIVWWVLPIDPSISWEGHLGGAIAGIILAVGLRTTGPKRAKYQWEIDEEMEALEALEAEKAIEMESDIKTPIEINNPISSTDNIPIKYTFKRTVSKNEKSDSIDNEDE